MLTLTRVYETWRHPNCVATRRDRLYFPDGRKRPDNYGKPREAYVDWLKNLGMKALRSETRQMIWLSAYASNNPRSDYHWMCDCCYDELMGRTKSDDAYADIHSGVTG